MRDGWQFLSDEAATLALGAALAKRLPEPAVVFLHGDLGAGKTTLVRGILHGRGFSGAVKSPTYTLLEPYEMASGAVFHFDFYRIADPQELEFIGVAEVLAGPGLKLIEWPQQAAERLPMPDVEIHLRDARTPAGQMAREARVDFRPAQAQPR